MLHCSHKKETAKGRRKILLLAANTLMPTSNKTSTNTMRKYFASLRMCMENLTWKKFAHIMSFPGTFKGKKKKRLRELWKFSCCREFFHSSIRKMRKKCESCAYIEIIAQRRLFIKANKRAYTQTYTFRSFSHVKGCFYGSESMRQENGKVNENFRTHTVSTLKQAHLFFRPTTIVHIIKKKSFFSFPSCFFFSLPCECKE